MSQNKLTSQEKEHLEVHYRDILKDKRYKLSLKEKLAIKILVLENKLSKLI